MTSKIEWLEEKYKELNDTVQICCDPPDDCNDPVVLKTYMKKCFDLAIKQGRDQIERYLN